MVAAAAAPVPRVQRAPGPGPGPAMAQRGGPAVLPDNPFQDPAVLQSGPGPVLDGYNPFESDAVSAGACPQTGACPGTEASSRPPEPSLLPAQSHRSPLPLQPPPPFQTPSVAPPPPVAAAAQPPRKASPTEPRNYGSYGSQVRGEAPPGRAGRGDAGPGGNPGFVSPLSAGLGRRRHGGAAEAAGGAQPESGGAGPAGAGAAERGPRRFPE